MTTNIAETEIEKRLAVEVSEDIRKYVKSTAALRGITMGEYITELVQRDQARGERGSKATDLPAGTGGKQLAKQS